MTSRVKTAGDRGTLCRLGSKNGAKVARPAGQPLDMLGGLRPLPEVTEVATYLTANTSFKRFLST